MISVRVGGVSFHVVAIDETFDSFLQVRRLYGELELFVQLGDQKVMRQRLPHLHNANDSSVDLILTILGGLEKKSLSGMTRLDNHSHLH